MNHNDIVVIGDLNVDIVCHVSSELNYGSDTSSINRLSLGGSPCNVSSWLCALGAQPTFYAAKGDDALGDWAQGELDALGLHRGGLHTVTGARTGSCVVLVSPNGERTMLPDPGANLELHLSNTMSDVIRRASVVVMSCYSFFRPETRQLALDVADLCSRNHVKLILDAASRAPIELLGAGIVRDYLLNAWLVVANEDEDAALMAGSDSDWKMSLRNVVVKNGSSGSRWFVDGVESTRITSESVAVVDTTGAGDAFMAGLVMSLFSDTGESVTYMPSVDRQSEALRQGNLAGATCVQLVGASPGNGAVSLPRVPQ